MIKPATPFGAGYHRSPDIEARLVEAVTKAIHDNPTQRFGQLVMNHLGRVRDPWNVWDEEAIQILNGPTL